MNCLVILSILLLRCTCIHDAFLLRGLWHKGYIIFMTFLQPCLRGIFPMRTVAVLLFSCSCFVVLELS